MSEGVNDSLDVASAPDRIVTPIARLAGRIGCTEGQIYTMVIGLILAIVLAVACIPTAIRHHGV